MVEVDIDIKPGSDPNSINPGSEGVIPVAVLTTTDFDAADIDQTQPINLGGVGVTSRGKSNKPAVSMEDVDGDGDIDLVAHFRTQDLVDAGTLTEGTLTLELEAQTTGGVVVRGTDTVNVVPGDG